MIYSSLLERLKTQHDSIPVLITKIGEDRLNRRSTPQKWSVKDTIAHLAKYQPVFLERINRILIEQSPSFSRYSADEDPEFAEWQERSVADLVIRLGTDREKIIHFFSQLKPGDFQRTGRHPKFGDLTLHLWLEFFVLHEAHHLFTIFQLCHEPVNLQNQTTK